MPKRKGAICSRVKWQGREAYAVQNDVVRMVALTGGGHIASFSFHGARGAAGMNPLWTPPWKTIDPQRYSPAAHAARYGPPPAGQLLAGIVGHNLCLDYFGAPSEEEARLGLAVHGEAPNQLWRKVRAGATAEGARLALATRLRVAGLDFQREIRLRAGESVAWLRETVTNRRDADHFFHWVEHATLGPPFVSHRDSIVSLPGAEATTLPGGYDASCLLRPDAEFRWPHAPGASGGSVDLTRPFPRPGFGFVAGILLDPRRDLEFVAVTNTRARLLFGYCFRRADFPWMTMWHEDRARKGPPWMGRCQSLGLEFGTTALPVGRRGTFLAGPLFGTQTLTYVPARASKTICYCAFLARLPADFGALGDVKLEDEALALYGSSGDQPLLLKAAGARQLLSAECGARSAEY